MTTTIDQTATVTNDPAAHAALRAAHEGSYRFPQGFAGFTANFTVVFGTVGDFRSIAGSVEVVDPRTVEITADGSDELAGWVKKELASMAGHRWGTPYEQGDGRWTLTIDASSDHPLGRLVTVHDDPFKSSYRVRDGRISQVVRTMGQTTFTISMQSHRPAPDGTVLPETFTVAFWDLAVGRLTRSDIYADAYAEVDGVLLPAVRRVLSATDAGIEGREFRLSGWKLRA